MAKFSLYCEICNMVRLKETKEYGYKESRE